MKKANRGQETILERKKKVLELLKLRIKEKSNRAAKAVPAQSNYSKSYYSDARRAEEEQLEIARRISLQQQRQHPGIDPDKMTYEQLLELEESIGFVSKGLTTSRIEVLLPNF